MKPKHPLTKSDKASYDALVSQRDALLSALRDMTGYWRLTIIREAMADRGDLSDYNRILNQAQKAIR